MARTAFALPTPIRRSRPGMVALGVAVVVALASVALVFLRASPTSHPHAGVNVSTSQPTVLYNQFVSALNRGDVTGAVALFSPDSRIVTPLCQPWCADSSAIAGDFRTDAAIHSHVTFADVRVRGDLLTSRVTLTAPQLPGGIQRAVGRNTVQVYKNRIVLLRLDFDRTDPQTAVFLNALGR